MSMNARQIMGSAIRNVPTRPALTTVRVIRASFWIQSMYSYIGL
jgi:hypothetical protein